MESPHLAVLRRAFRERKRVVVAFSGGVDSAVLARVAHDALGADALSVIVDSESYAREEREAAVAFARDMGLPHEVVFVSELSNPEYAANPVNRCYHCRSGLADVLTRIARERGFEAVAVGTNASDLAEWRPGLVAIRERGLWQPFMDLDIDKAGVRDLARELGLPVADKPSMACLSSRIPYGEPITLGKLQRVGAAESHLRALGFRQVRVRSHGDLARVEVLPDEIPRLRDAFAGVRARLLAIGYGEVEIDERGYRSGSLNEGLNLRLKVAGE